MAKDIVMQFGGLKALNKVTLSIAVAASWPDWPQRLGKSTMMNVITGIYVPIA
jgi:branched-chain amino acid transport system permease protein